VKQIDKGSTVKLKAGMGYSTGRVTKVNGNIVTIRQRTGRIIQRPIFKLELVDD
jgi:hypothetical protein